MPVVDFINNIIIIVVIFVNIIIIITDIIIAIVSLFNYEKSDLISA